MIKVSSKDWFIIKYFKGSFLFIGIRFEYQMDKNLFSLVGSRVVSAHLYLETHGLPTMGDFEIRIYKIFPKMFSFEFFVIKKVL